MQSFDVCEKFASINGEGRRAGETAVFIRFKGCNLSCSYCDTKWANAEDAPSQPMTTEEICFYIKSTGIKNVTLTGGEPLLQAGIEELLRCLKADGFSVEIETNGSVDISKFCAPDIRPDCFTMDYKLPYSGMEEEMLISNFEHLGRQDCVKFVSGREADLAWALDVINHFKLAGRCSVYISPVFGAIEPKRIVEFMLDNKMNDVRLQIQMHKVIWDPNKRGV